MKRSVWGIVGSLAIIALLVSAFALAETLAESKPEKGYVRLAVKEKLQTKIAKRMRTAKPEFKYFTPDKVIIDRVEPIRLTISGHPSDLYAVSLRLTPPTGSVEASRPMTLVVDEACELVIGDVADLATGKSLFQDALDRVSAISLPADFGHDVLAGQGSRDVVLVSDPYCPFCRRAWDYLMTETKRIRKLRLAHMPLIGLHPGADTACKFMLVAPKVGVPVLEAVTFAYRDLQPAKGANPALDVAGQYLERFPELKTRFKTSEAALKALDKEVGAILAKDAQTAQEMGITGTPAIFVDGVQVRGGFDQARTAELLGK